MNETQKALVLAVTFQAILEGWLSKEEQAAVALKNAELVGSCATQDYCDANEAMWEAYQSVYGAEELNAENEWQTARMNAAWDAFKKISAKVWGEAALGSYLKLSLEEFRASRQETTAGAQSDLLGDGFAEEEEPIYLYANAVFCFQQPLESGNYWSIWGNEEPDAPLAELEKWLYALYYLEIAY